MLLAALTLVPAILSLLGINLFWPTRPAVRTSSRRTRSERIGDMVAKHPGIVLTTWAVVLVALAFGALGFKTTYNQLAELPASTPSQVAYNTMASAFPAGYLGPTQVFVTSDTSAPLNQADVSRAGIEAVHHPGGLEGPASPVHDHRRTGAHQRPLDR